MAIHGHSRSLVQGHWSFDVHKKPLGDYILRHNNFGLIYMTFRQIKRPQEATRTATHSCRDPETRMSFLIASWHRPQGLNQNFWCRILSLICVKSFITIGWETIEYDKSLENRKSDNNNMKKNVSGSKNVNFRRHHSHNDAPYPANPHECWHNPYILTK